MDDDLDLTQDAEEPKPNPNDVTIALTGVGAGMGSGYTPPKEVREAMHEFHEKLDAKHGTVVEEKKRAPFPFEKEG
jgi:hypothetical protein